MKRLSLAALAILMTLGLAVSAHAGAIRSLAGFTANTFPGNDDGFTGPITLGAGFNGGAGIDFFGATHTTFFLNNNGNITFNSGLSTFTPFGLTGGGVPPMIAPFFADVDTRVGGSPVTYGTDTLAGHTAFGVDWINVNFFAAGNHPGGPYNDFQLILIDRSDIAAGDFDFEFNYDHVRWETGQASGSNASGLGGSSARVGYSNGLSGGSNVSDEICGSGVNGALLDGSTYICPDLSGGGGLINNSNVGVAGRYLFTVRSGTVTQVDAVPEPATLLLLGSGLIAVARRFRKTA